MRIVLSQKGAVTNMGKLHRSFVKLKSPKGMVSDHKGSFDERSV